MKFIVNNEYDMKGYPMIKESVCFGVAVFTALVCFTGCKPPPREEVKRIVPVRVYVAQPDTITATVFLTGGVEAGNDAIVFSKVTERLTTLKVKPGDRVRAGQLLAEQYNRGALEGKTVAAAALKSAEVQVKARRDDFTRMSNLLDKKAVTRQQYDQSKTQLEIAEATREQAAAVLEQAVVQYENTILRAPFSGRIAAVWFDLNETVPAGRQVIKIINAHSIKAKLNIPSVDIDRITVGKGVTARFPSIPDRKFTGTISRMDEALDPTTRTLRAEVTLENKENLLKSGMFGEFTIETKRHADAVVVNELTVLNRTRIVTDERGFQTEQPEYYIYIIANGTALKKTVTPGIVAGGSTEIVNGVTFGDSIIVAGQNIVKDGDAIRIVN
jgi:membrane fusion protein, multidrug efflux system